MNKFFALASFAFTGVLLLGGIILCTLKLFGLPFFFEGIVIFSAGMILITCLMTIVMMQKVIDTFTEVLKVPMTPFTFDASASGNTKTISIIHDEDGNVKMDSNLSPEEMEAWESTPAFKSIMDNINNGFDGLSNFNPANLFKKELKDYNRGELEVMLRAAIETDDFEQAEALKKELDGR